MKKVIAVLVLLALLAGGAPVLADGMFYWREEVPPGIPYQRAILLFEDGREILVLQSQYHVPGAAPDASLGWVVPVPAVPELASMDPWNAGEWFHVASDVSSPDVREIDVLAFTPLLPFLAVLGSLLFSFLPGRHATRRYRRTLAVGALALLFSSLASASPAFWDMPDWLQTGLYLLAPISAVLVPLAGVCWAIANWTQLGTQTATTVVVNSMAALAATAACSTVLLVRLGAAPAGRVVDVIQAEQVGIYDVQVVTAGRAGDLIEWLNQAQFHYDADDTQVFDGYLQRGWCFVVARVNPASGSERDRVGWEGLVAPLILRFPAEAPVYPLALTATAGQKTEILLYLLSHHKWATDGRLELQYAGWAGDLRDIGAWVNRHELIQPAGFLSAAETDLPYLCKFKGTLTPGQMRDDLILRRAADDEPYRKRIVVW